MFHISVIVLRNAEQRFLLQFRDADAPSNPLGWSLFGGRSEVGESPEETLIREIKEELNLDLSADECTLLAEEPWVGRSGEKIVHFYECSRVIDWSDVHVLEGAGAAFLSIDELQNLEGVSALAKYLIRTYCS